MPTLQTGNADRRRDMLLFHRRRISAPSNRPARGRTESGGASLPEYVRCLILPDERTAMRSRRPSLGAMTPSLFLLLWQSGVCYSWDSPFSISFIAAPFDVSCRLHCDRPVFPVVLLGIIVISFRELDGYRRDPSFFSPFHSGAQVFLLSPFFWLSTNPVHVVLSPFCTFFPPFFPPSGIKYFPLQLIASGLRPTPTRLLFSALPTWPKSLFSVGKRYVFAFSHD